MNRKEFMERLEEAKKELGAPLEFNLMEETFSVRTYVFNAGYPYLKVLQHYHDHATEDDEYSEMFLDAEWLKEILEKVRK
jgi:hypothetical protein